MEQKHVDLGKIILWGSITVMAFLTIISAIIANLMSFGLIPTDWYCFHNYLRRTGEFRLGMSLVPFITFALLSIINRFKPWLTKKTILLVIFWLFLSVTLDALGNIFGWYGINESYGIIWYDNLTHTMGGINATSIMFIVWSDLVKKQRIKIPLRYKTALAFFSAFTIGVFFEVYEYYSDVLIKTNMVGGVDDIITDIVYNTLGGAIAIFLLFVSHFKGGIIKHNPYKYLTTIEDAKSKRSNVSTVSTV